MQRRRHAPQNVTHPHTKTPLDPHTWDSLDARSPVRRPKKWSMTSPNRTAVELVLTYISIHYFFSSTKRTRREAFYRVIVATKTCSALRIYQFHYSHLYYHQNEEKKHDEYVTMSSDRVRRKCVTDLRVPCDCTGTAPGKKTTTMRTKVFHISARLSVSSRNLNYIGMAVLFLVPTSCAETCFRY